MVNTVEHTKRACETVTFRLTSYEKQLIAHLAGLEGRTRTDLIRDLVRRYAKELGIDEIPEPAPRRRPGRPKGRTPSKSAPPLSHLGPAEVSQTVWRAPSDVRKGTFGALVADFMDHSEGRGERVRRELAETVDFISGFGGTEPLLSRDLPLEELTREVVIGVREKIKLADIRFPVKNLHLTYLRMIFNFGVKRGDIRSSMEPAIDLVSFTAKELQDALPVPVKTI